MKKLVISIIALVTIIILAFFGWYFFVRDQNITVSDFIVGDSPFGSGDGFPSTGEKREVLTPAGEALVFDEFGSPKNGLFRISDTSVAGALALIKGTSTEIVRYVDGATGHIYDVDLATGEKTKITNQTLPKIYEAYFRSDGRAVLVRALKDDTDTIENLSIALTPPKAGEGLYTASSTAFRGNIGAVAVGANDTLFYTLRDTTSIVSSPFSGRSPKTLLDSPFTDWRLATNSNNLVVYTKASARADGYAYTLSGGSLTKILGPFPGLVALPNSTGKKVLFSYVDGSKTRLFVKNLTDNSLYEISSASLAEKCVWGKKSPDLVFCGVPIEEIGLNEPDAWYKGVTHFSDRVWLFDTQAKTAQLIVEPRGLLDIDIDVYAPQLSVNETYLIFINKLDRSLWALKLEQA